jgi:hypothetical protein
MLNYLNLKTKKDSVQAMRHQLSKYIKRVKSKEHVEKVSVTGEITVVRLQSSQVPQRLRDTTEGTVLSDLLKHVPRLKSEEPKEIEVFCG